MSQITPPPSSVTGPSRREMREERERLARAGAKSRPAAAPAAPEVSRAEAPAPSMPTAPAADPAADRPSQGASLRQGPAAPKKGGASLAGLAAGLRARRGAKADHGADDLPSREPAPAPKLVPTAAGERGARAPQVAAVRTTVVEEPAKVGVTLLKKVWLAFALITFLVGLSATFAYPLFQRNENREVVTVLSGSMEPTYNVRGSLLVDKSANVRELKKNDVITFAVAGTGTPTTHRIIDVTTDPTTSSPIFTTKGDANASPDVEPVTAANVVGKVEKDLGLWGRFTTFMQYGWDFGADPSTFPGSIIQDNKWFTRALIFAPAALTIILPELFDLLIVDTFLDPRHRRRKKALAAAQAARAAAA